MSFLNRLLSKITHLGVKSNQDSFLDRIESLLAFSSKKKYDLEVLKAKKIDVSWYRLEKVSNENNLTYPVFVYRPIELRKSMNLLQEKRQKEETERLRQLRILVNNKIDYLKSLISSKKVNVADIEIHQLYPLIKELKDNSLEKEYHKITRDLFSLKEIIKKEAEERRIRLLREAEEREKRRKQEEERRKREELKKQQEQERIAIEYERELLRKGEEIRQEKERLINITSKRKKNYQEFINYLNCHGVSCFYHFTDENNLQSIKKHGGLLSWHYCMTHDVRIPNAGGDELSRSLDKKQNLEDYVRLSFCSDHPMAFRKKQEGANLVLLKIKIDVATFLDTLFSNVNAAANDCSFGGNLSDLQRVNIDATQRTYVRKDDNEFHLHQAECMVKTFIPIDYIINIDNPKTI